MSKTRTASFDYRDPVAKKDNPTTPYNRIIKSCLECRRRKMRCNRSRPCQHCSRFARQCQYLSSSNHYPSPCPSEHGGELEQSDPIEAFDGFAQPLEGYKDEKPTFASTSPNSDGFGFVKIEGHRNPNTRSQAQAEDVYIGRLRITEKMGGLSSRDLTSTVSLDPAFIPYPSGVLVLGVCRWISGGFLS